MIVIPLSKILCTMIILTIIITKLRRVSRVSTKGLVISGLWIFVVTLLVYSPNSLRVMPKDLPEWFEQEASFLCLFLSPAIFLMIRSFFGRLGFWRGFTTTLGGFLFGVSVFVYLYFYFEATQGPLKEYISMPPLLWGFCGALLPFVPSILFLIFSFSSKEERSSTLLKEENE